MTNANCSKKIILKNLLNLYKSSKNNFENVGKFLSILVSNFSHFPKPLFRRDARGPGFQLKSGNVQSNCCDNYPRFN